MKWSDASASLKDLFENKYVNKWTSHCKFDVRFGFKSPYLALQFSGKILEHLRVRWSLRPSQCMCRLGKKTIRVNSWKTDMSMLCDFWKMKITQLFVIRRNSIPNAIAKIIKSKFTITSKIS